MARQLRGIQRPAHVPCVYYNNPRTPEEVETTRKQGASNGKATTTYHQPGDPLVDPDWIANPEGSPKRQRTSTT